MFGGFDLRFERLVIRGSISVIWGGVDSVCQCEVVQFHKI